MTFQLVFQNPVTIIQIVVTGGHTQINSTINSNKPTRYSMKILSPLAISVVIKIYVVTHNQVIHYLYGLIIVYAKFGCIHSQPIKE